MGRFVVASHEVRRALTVLPPGGTAPGSPPKAPAVTPTHQSAGAPHGFFGSSDLSAPIVTASIELRGEMTKIHPLAVVWREIKIGFARFHASPPFIVREEDKTVPSFEKELTLPDLKPGATTSADKALPRITRPAISSVELEPASKTTTPQTKPRTCPP